jgi:hypothetical protein
MLHFARAAIIQRERIDIIAWQQAQCRCAGI